MQNKMVVQPDARVMVMNLLAKRYRADWLAAELHREFTRHDYVRLPGLFSDDAFSTIKSEVGQLELLAKSKDFIMDGYETPRIMSTVGGSTILSASRYLWPLYTHAELRTLIERITGRPVFPCLHPNEFMVANYLLGPGSTHGWHLDDPAYALILFVDSPAREDGGLLEFIPGWRDYCARLGVSAEENVDRVVDKAHAAGLVQVRHHQPGDAYLLRADQCLHRVTPLQSLNVRRVVLNLAYEVTPEPTYGHTASQLYGED